MLTAHVERWRVMEATRLGVNEFLKKPVSGKALLDRMLTILTRPRPDGTALATTTGPSRASLFARRAESDIHGHRAPRRRSKAAVEAEMVDPEPVDAAEPEVAEPRSPAAWSCSDRLSRFPHEMF